MPPKRKRPDRPSGDGNRPSPHRPGDTSLAQHDRDDNGGRGRRGPRGSNRRDSSQGHGRGSSTQPPSQSSTPQRNSSSQQPSQTLPPPSAPAASTRPAPPEQVHGPTSPVRSHYRYDNLTDEKIRTWASGGRAEIVGHGVQSREDVDVTELASLFAEFVHAVVEAKLDPTDAGACVKEILGDETSEMIKDSYTFAPHTLFLDALALVFENDPDLYRPTLREFLIATGVSTALMRQLLDIPLLQQLNLTRPTFNRNGIKHQTNMLYRQANYNLLREETEGYSKLITELFASFNTTPLSPAEQTFEKIKALIGTFDLDVGRVLDVTLDVAAPLLIKQPKFWVQLLRVSSWWPQSQSKIDESVWSNGLPSWALPGWVETEEEKVSNAARQLARDIAFWDRARETHLSAYFELGGRQITDPNAQQLAITNGQDSNDDVVARLHAQWIQETKTIPPPGNYVAAQLLGFKMLFYHSERRTMDDVLPANLLYLVSILIKIGFISLPDLYPHLSPDDDQMEETRQARIEELEKEKRETRSGPTNALLLAGVLPQGDDDNPMSNHARREPLRKADADKKQTEKDATEQNKEAKPTEQKITLLVELLTMGALPEALFILGRFPWIPELYPEVLIRIHRILNTSLAKVHSETRPKSTDVAECPRKQMADSDQSGMPKGSVRLVPTAQKKSTSWPYPSLHDSAKNVPTFSYKFYWPEWSDNVPVCQTVDDVFTLCGTFLNLSGVNIGKDEPLLAKLASIGEKSLADDKSDFNLARWQDLLRRLLVPALSHTKSNASVVNAIWRLLRRYPMTTRYGIYAEWFEGQISRLPAMKEAFAQATSDTRGTMKRVSLTNLSEMAKKLAKISYSSPGITFKVAFEQLESYPNLIEAFVECAKYFTDLSYDVLGWSLMNSLGKSRSRTQADHALTTSKWLTALSKFSGRVFRRYSLLDPTPVLQYVNDQLLQGNSTDLIILKELMSSMGGIVDSGDFTDYQILSMAGGPVLRRHTLIRGQDKRFDNVHSSKRLIRTLTDTKLGARLLISLAQYRQAAIFKVPEDQAHIKYLSWIVDDSQQTLVQYLDFLWTGLDPAGYDATVPSIAELIGSYGLDTSLAFLIGRASLSQQMFPWKVKSSDESKDKDDAKEKAQASQLTADKDGDVSMVDPKAPNGTNGTPSQESVEGNDQVGAARPDTQGSPTNPKLLQKLDEPSLIRTALQPIADIVQKTIRPEVWDKITPELYVTFWALQLADLFCPEKSYRQERERVKGEEQVIARDRSDMSRRGQERKMEKRKDLMQLQIGLSEECREHLLRQAKWKFHLTKQFSSFFPDPTAKADSISDILLEQCFLPRVLLSAADAEYTFRFIKALHEWNAPGFKLMSLYDRLFNANRLRSIIFTSTVREAEHLGRFLKLVLQDLARWHKNDPVPNEKDSKTARDQPRIGVYEKEGKGPSDQPRLGFVLTVDENGKPATFVEHAQFRDLLFRWHKNLNMALKSCLGGTEWMHIRNALTVLNVVLDCFPAVDFMATQFLSQLQKIFQQESASKTAAHSEEAHRVDLAVAAQGAMSELQKRKPKWVMVQAFRPNTVGGSQSEADKTSPANLRPTAPEFKPHPGRTLMHKPAAAEEEDGEVRDNQDGKSSHQGASQSTGNAPKDLLPVKPTPTKDTPRRDGTPSGPPRTSTPRSGHGQGPNGARGDPRSNMLPDRPPHNLPTRPDVPIPAAHYGTEQHPQSRRPERPSRDHVDSRGPRDPRTLRDSRGFEPDRLERSREPADRRPVDNARDANRLDLPPRPGPHERERSHRESRESRPSGRLSEAAAASPTPPTTQTAAMDAQEPAMNPERAALFAQDGPDRTPRGPDSDRSSKSRRPAQGEVSEAVNPERAAFMTDRDDNTPSRPPRDSGRDRLSGRTHSPRRPQLGPEPGPPDVPREERHGRTYPDGRPGRDPRDSRVDPRSRSPASGGFRDRMMGHDNERGPMDAGRDAQGFFKPPPRGQEPYQDQNYGRLNPVPSTSDIPLGPRGRGRGTSRGGQGGPHAMPGRNDGRLGPPDHPRPASPDRQPPTGPSSGRGRRGFESGSGPPTPTGTPGNQHTDRMRSFGQGPDVPSPASSNATPAFGVHPDRLAQLGGPLSQPTPPPPPPGPPPHNHARNSMTGSNHADRSGQGPRQSTGSMNSFGPPDGGPPLGPASSDERTKAGGGRRQLAGINNTLQKAQATMPETSRSSSSGNGSARRSQPRQMLGNSDAQVLTGGSEASTPAQERPDPMSSELTSRGPAGDESNRGDGERRRESRSDRPSRSSRRSSRDRERSAGREREGKEQREHRDRRSGAGTEVPGSGAGREDRESRRSTREGGGREPMGPPSTGTGGRELMTGRDPRHRGEGPSGPSGHGEEWNGGGGGSGTGSMRGRGAPREGGHRPDDRRDDRGRKRRSEDGVGMLASEREKRPRR